MAKTALRGIVNQIISGDSIEIRGKVCNGPPPKIVVILSNIRCPKLGRRPSANAPATADEPFAWEARELLRKSCIGKEVLYYLEKEVRAGVNYGSVFLVDGDKNESIGCLLLSSGYGVLRESKNPEITGTENYQSLFVAQQNAKDNRVGQWGEQAIRRRLIVDFEEVAAFVSDKLSTPIDSIVEYVRDASSMQVLLLVPKGNELLCYSTMVMLTGVRPPGKNQNSERFAPHAHYLVESRVLHRDVKLIVDSVNRFNVSGSVLYHNGNIAIHLLRQGLAQCIETGLSFLSPAAAPGGASDYRAAEDVAKKSLKFIWQDWNPEPVASQDQKPVEIRVAGGIVVGEPFQGTVVEVGNGDSVMVRCPDGQLRKFFLAHLRPPRLSDDERQQMDAAKKIPRPLYDVSYAFDAREFLRKKLVGKNVSITVEYVQPKLPNTSMEDRFCVSVNLGGQTINEGLVAKGLATVLQSRNAQAGKFGVSSRKAPASAPNVEVKKSLLDVLLTAEEAARTKNIGLHSSSSDVSKIRVNEVARNPQMARQVLPTLKRAGRLPAIVEFVTSPTRVRLFLTHDRMLVNLLLEGIVCPQTSRNESSPDEPFSQEALSFVRENFMQRDVEVEIENVDRAGNFIGWIYRPGKDASNDLGKKKKKQAQQEPKSASCQVTSDNLAVLLVASGLATRWSPTYSGAHAAELCEAESIAKQKKAGQWSNADFIQRMQTETVDTNGGNHNSSSLTVDKNSDGSNGVQDLPTNNAKPGTLDGSRLASNLGGRWQKENLYMEELAGVNGKNVSDAKLKDLTSENNSRRLANRKRVELSYIVGPHAGSFGLRFFVQFSSNAEDIERTTRELNNPNADFLSTAADFRPNTKAMCAAKFSADNYWYRARVQRVDHKNNFATVLFVDFGNTENVPLSENRLAQLPEQLAKLGSLATEFRLAAIQLPMDAQQQSEAIYSLGKLITSKQVFIVNEHNAVPCGKEDLHPVPSVSVLLYSPRESTDSIENVVDAGEYLLREGLVHLEPFRPHILRLNAALLHTYIAGQNAAKEAHSNIWRFGDIREDLVEAN